MPNESNTIYIGRKPAMSYVLAVITNFNSSDTKEVTLKARGWAMRARATEEIQREEDGTRNVSTIEITLTRD
jgi:DNA-binding protein